MQKLTKNHYEFPGITIRTRLCQTVVISLYIFCNI